MASSDNDEWHLTFSNFVLSLYPAAHEGESGSENPTEVENQKILSLVPEAEQELKKHPNDKKLCNVMQKPLGAHSKLEAQQIAFFNVGSQNCSQYYDKPESWGDWAKKIQMVFNPVPAEKKSCRK